MFDRLMLLARGKIIYFNKADLAVNYFSNIGFQCPDLSNPADYFMTMMSIESIELDNVSNAGSVFIDQDRIQEEYKKTIDLFDRKYRESDLVNDHTEVHPGVQPINNDKMVAQTTWAY